MSMLSNLISCNKINIYSGTNTSFMNILEELKEINDIIISLPNKITLSDLREFSLKDITIKLYKIYKLLIKYSNHISFENFNYILEIFGGNNWVSNFEEGDLSLDDLSPAINSGVLLNGYLIDINGNTRLNPDIGAYEK